MDKAEKLDIDMEFIDKKAKTLWEKARFTVANYDDYLIRKAKIGKFNLNIVDLLFASNFKGGNGSIQEDSKSIKKKLIPYSKLLCQINDCFPEKQLSELNNDELINFLKFVRLLISICQSESFRIDGFGISYCSTLFHLYFPNLIPVLDRRILIGTTIVDKLEQLDSQGQIKNIGCYFESLVIKLHTDLKAGLFSSLDDADKYYFVMQIPKNLQVKKAQKI